MEKSSKKQLPGFVVLAVIAIVAALVLALTNSVTEGPINEHRMAALRAAYNEVMPAADYEEMQIPAGCNASGLYAAKDESGSVIGYCVTASAKGYGGDVAVILGVDPNGTVTGSVIGDNNFAETDGFGKRWQEPDNQARLVGLSAVDGGEFLPLSGATVSSKAVKAATNDALATVRVAALNMEPAEGDLVAFGEKAAPVVDAAAIQPGATLRGEAEGYGGQNVIVTVKLGDDATIANIKVDASSQTPGLGQRCAEDAFTAQFIGKSIPVEGIDTISGVTLTSNAVVDAINGAQPCEADDDAVTAMAEKDGVAVGVNDNGEAIVNAGGNKNATVTMTLTVKDGKVVDAQIGDVVAAAAAIVPNENGELVHSKQGFASKVGVTVTLNADGTIATIKVNAANETEYVGTKCGEPAFTDQFIGKKAPFILGENVDAVSGATITSTAVVDCLNEMLPADDNAVMPEPGTELSASKQGFASKVGVTVTLDENMAIATIKVNAANETEYVGTKCGEAAFTDQFIGKKAPFVIGENVDAVSGATITSTAVVDLLNELVPADQPMPAATPVAPNENGELVGSKQGFASKVGLTVTLDETGAIATLKVNAANETEYVGTKCGEAAFTDQFIGKKAPFVIGENVDAVSGATITSTAVVDLINELTNPQ